DETFVVVTVTSIDENGVEGMMIYPNPTKDNVTISAEGIERITITNALGQVMLDKVVNSDSEILNMGQYEAGVYMVRIVTANGVATERITVL
ncbi:MAG: T9SS type A sorting domain-containing protein, partial [Bacteroidales bacterium]|nr:T9SS type A sorting domain-containing protein [Bacteroidales bacterium]